MFVAKSNEQNLLLMRKKSQLDDVAKSEPNSKKRTIQCKEDPQVQSPPAVSQPYERKAKVQFEEVAKNEPNSKKMQFEDVAKSVPNTQKRSQMQFE
jgi:hypothetical protein